ncbi:MAG TPA: DoxX family membrane protein [Anaeromyxobacter sp.]|nr:DoxX family membrane protein [Anaeromyxobacter sp.]
MPEVLLAVAIGLELAGGLSLLLGWKTRLGAVALLAFLVPVTLVFHAFWAMPAGQAQQEMIQFLKNLSIAGGVVAILAAGPGALSLDALRERGRARDGAPVRAAA